jgi:uncharacterized delta-60 repeat protein
MRVLSALPGSRRRAAAAVAAAGLALALTVVVVPTAGAAPPGWLDRTYGSNGWGLAGSYGTVPSQGAVDSSGRAVLITGDHSSAQAVTRLTVDGAVDSTFGTLGSTAVPSPAFGRVLVGSDGIYLLQAAAPGSTSAAVARLTPNGLLDPTYGVGGIATVTFTSFPGNGFSQIAQLSDGTVVLAGDGVIAALDSTGTLDPTWDPSGPVPGVLSGLGHLSGLTADGTTVVATETAAPAASHLHRWLRSGAPDSTLGGTGAVALPLPWQFDGAFTGPDGDYYLTATKGGPGYRSHGVARMLPAGTLDPTYGAAGVSTLPVQDSSPGGASVTFRGTAAYVFTSYGVGDPEVVRLSSTGAPDPTFGAGGLVQLMKRDLPAGQLPRLAGGGVQPDGRVVVLLGYVDPVAATTPLGAVRLNATSIALAGSFVPLVPARLLDTRSGLGAPQGRVPGATTVHLQVGGRGGVPAVGAASVVLNLTSVRPTSSGHVTAFPTGQGRPRSSSLNYSPGQTTANLANIGLGAGGQVTLTNSSSGTTDLLADVVGYYLTGTPTVAGSYVTLPQFRLVDTRVGRGAPQGKVAKQSTLPVTVAGAGGVPMTGVSAVVLNLTVTGTLGSGYITPYPSGLARPTTSTLNHGAGETRANLVTVRLGADGKIDLYNGSLGGTDLIVDLAGYYLDGAATSPGTFVALDPVRVLDTRNGTGAVKRPVHAASDIQFAATGAAGPPASDASAVLLNSTVTAATRAGQVTVMGGDIGWGGNPWDYVHNRPSYQLAYPGYPTSTVNFRAGQTVANLTVVTGSSLALAHNGSSGTLQLVADLAGYFNP